MEESFWQGRWKSGLTGWHEGRPNALLEAHFNRLALSPGDHVFVPLCGAAVDVNWLAAQNVHVIGAEFNEDAARQIFARDGAVPPVEDLGSLRRYSDARMTLYVGDIFALTAARLGKVDAVYDRAALVALPSDVRERYAAHLLAITKAARHLIIAFDYDQTRMDGPPFSVPASEVTRLYAPSLKSEVLETRPVQGPLAERCAGEELAMLLERSVLKMG